MTINALDFFIFSGQEYFLQRLEEIFCLKSVINHDENLDLTGLKANRKIREYLANELELSLSGEMLKNVKADELVFWKQL